MLRYIILLSAVLGSTRLVDGHAQQSRMVARKAIETARCGLPMLESAMSQVLATHDKDLAGKKMKVDQLNAMFAYTSEKIESLKKKSPFFSKAPVLPGPALTMLSSIRKLRDYECDNYCAFVLIENTCDAGRHLGACHPKHAREQSLVAAMIDSEVYPFLERCYKPLYSKAIDNKVAPNVLETITFMTDSLSTFTMRDQWANEEEMFLKAPKPLLMAGYLIAPHKNGFYDKVLNVMIELEKKKTGKSTLKSARDSHSLKLKPTEKKYNELIIEPCLAFMDRLYKIMDPLKTFGHWIEAKTPSIFKLPSISNKEKLEFFRVYRNYDTCAWFVHSDFSLAWEHIVK